MNKSKRSPATDFDEVLDPKDTSALVEYFRIIDAMKEPFDELCDLAKLAACRESREIALDAVASAEVAVCEQLRKLESHALASRTRLAMASVETAGCEVPGGDDPLDDGEAALPDDQPAPSEEEEQWMMLSDSLNELDEEWLEFSSVSGLFFDDPDLVAEGIKSSEKLYAIIRAEAERLMGLHLHKGAA